MTKLVIRCVYTGHYILTGMLANKFTSGKIYCPYCEADHTWNCEEKK